MTEFELLLLPPKAQKNVLRTMGYVEVIGFSLCSKFSKRLITSLKYAAQNVKVQSTLEFKLYMLFQQNRLVIMFPFETPQVIEVQEPIRDVREYQKETFAVNDWIAHLATIFHIKIIQKVTVFGEETPVEYIQNAMERMEFKTLRIYNFTNEHTENLVRRLVPRDAFLKHNQPFQCSSGVLLQNLKVLNVSFCQNWKLNDLLMLNAKYAYLMLVQLTSTDMNRFLKLWMRGSNPHLMFLQSRAETSHFVKHAVKKGIEGLEIPEETARTFDRWDARCEVRREEVRGGFDIRRFDGTLGTLFFIREQWLNFLVWQ